MMNRFVAFSVALLFLFQPNLFAQKTKTPVDLEPSSAMQAQTTAFESSEPSSAPVHGPQFPTEEEKLLVAVQESKIKLLAQKKSVPEKKSQPMVLESTADPVIVTATRNPQPLSQIGLPVSIITRKQIEREGEIQALDALRAIPGMTVVRSGTRGRTTSLFLRGANANQTLFMVDGVQYTSPTTGFFDITNLMLEDIERIEVIKGPQSDLYGSEAMGGVINIITRTGSKGRPKVSGQFQYGSEYTFYEAGSVSGGVGPVDYFGTITRMDSLAGVGKRRIEGDGYQDINVTGRGGIQLPFNSKLDTSYRFISGLTSLDDGTFRNDINRWSKTKDNVVTSVLTLNPFTWLTETIKGSYFDERLLSVDPGNPGLARPERESAFKLDARIYTLDWQNTVRLFSTNTVTAGYQFEVQRANNRTIDKIIRDGGYYVQDQQSFWDRLFLTAGARLEDNSAFGNSFNPKVSAAYLLKETKTKFKASFGTAFKTPTMNELYFPNFGNLNLLPEKSRGYDWGIEQQLPFLDASIEADMYHNSFENLIQALPAPGGRFIAQNTGKATMDGIELILNCKPIPGFLELSGFYSYLITHDKSIAGGELVRRPKNSGGVNVNLHFLKKWNFNIDASLVGSRKDRTGMARRPPVEINNGYGLINLMLSYDLMDHWQIYGKAENVTNTDYDEVLGFQTSGALFFGGVKMKY